MILSRLKILTSISTSIWLVAGVFSCRMKKNLRHEGEGPSKNAAVEATPTTAPISDALPETYSLFPGLSEEDLIDRDKKFCGDAVLATPSKSDDLKENQLSHSFLNNCAGCHGLGGEGKEKNPDLSKVASTKDFADIVRSGRKNMPAFSVEYYPDEDLKRDAKVLQNFSQDKQILYSGFNVPVPRSGSISEDAFKKTMNDAMKVWRDPGDGGACASCHGPDPIDLARIGYSNAAILRRAIGQGRSAEEGMKSWLQF